MTPAYKFTHPKYAGPSDDPHFIPDSPIMTRQYLSPLLEHELIQSCNALMPHLQSPSTLPTSLPPPPSHMILGSSQEEEDMSSPEPPMIASFVVPNAPLTSPTISQPKAFSFSKRTSLGTERLAVAASVNSGSSRSISGSLPTAATSVLLTPDELPSKAKDYLSINTVSIPRSISSVDPNLNSPTYSQPATSPSKFSFPEAPVNNLISPVSATFEEILNQRNILQTELDFPHDMNNIAEDDSSEEDAMQQDDEDRNGGWWRSVAIGRRSGAYHQLADVEMQSDGFNSKHQSWRQSSGSEYNFESSISPFSEDEPDIKVPATIIDVDGNEHVMTAEEEDARRAALQAAVFAKMTGGGASGVATAPKPMVVQPVQLPRMNSTTSAPTTLKKSKSILRKFGSIRRRNAT